MNVSDAHWVRSVRGPVTLITIGVLFALNNFTKLRFDQTWPVILIVFGLLTLLRRGAPHVPPQPGGLPPYSAPPYNPPPPTGYTGTYRQSSYGGAETPQAGPVKGGFGTSAPPRPGEPETPPPAPGGNV